MYLESCLVRTWSGGGQSVAETCTGQVRHVSATSQPRVPVDITCITEEVKGSDILIQCHGKWGIINR